MFCFFCLSLLIAKIMHWNPLHSYTNMLCRLWMSLFKIGPYLSVCFYIDIPQCELILLHTSRRRWATKHVWQACLKRREGDAPHHYGTTAVHREYHGVLTPLPRSPHRIVATNTHRWESAGYLQHSRSRRIRHKASLSQFRIVARGEGAAT